MGESGFLDTSIVIRYVLGEHPVLSARAAAIIDSDTDLFLTDGTIAEVAHVLTKVYGVPRGAALEAVLALVQRRNIRTYAMEKAFVVQALEMCRPSARVSFADALLWASARSAGATIIYAFDERFPADGLAVRREA
jgi:predicted nucleic acid-binding protein